MHGPARTSYDRPVHRPRRTPSEGGNACKRIITEVALLAGVNRCENLHDGGFDCRVKAAATLHQHFIQGFIQGRIGDHKQNQAIIESGAKSGQAGWEEERDWSRPRNLIVDWLIARE